MLAVFTQTSPLPPPGAAGFAAADCAGLSFFPIVVAGIEDPAAPGVGAGIDAGALVAGTGAGSEFIWLAAYQLCTPLWPWQAVPLVVPDV